MQRVTTIAFVMKVPISTIKHCKVAIVPSLEKFDIVGSNSTRSMDAITKFTYAFYRLSLNALQHFRFPIQGIVTKVYRTES
jgi:hypothetical protein